MKKITGIFLGCKSSTEKDCDELHLKIPIESRHGVSFITGTYPINMFSGVAYFVHLGLEKADKICFGRHDDGWVDIESIEILEKAADKDLLKEIEGDKAKRKRRRKECDDQKATAYDPTIGWYKDSYYGETFPVKRGPQGGIWIWKFGDRSYISKKRYNALKKLGLITPFVSEEKEEQMADFAHKVWANWTKYMLENMTPENIKRWKRQILTPYPKLSEKEKASDRKICHEWLDEYIRHHPELDP